MAVHFMTALACFREKASSDLLAETVRTNPVVVRRLLSELNRAGLIRSERGKNGGSALARVANDITLFDIYRTVMGNTELVNLHDNPENRGCAMSCKVRGVLSQYLQKAQSLYESELANVSLADIANEM